MRARDFILSTQNVDGGWGYKPGGMSYVEPTAAVLLALDGDASIQSARERAHAWLRQLQHPDGGWGIAALDDESGWMTAWAVWALARVGESSAQRGVNWLLKAEGLRVSNPADIERLRAILHIDPTITGWSWQPGDAAWIFPTALSLMALEKFSLRDHARVREGVQYLLDRAIPTGGWNIGNPFMVSEKLSPTVINTALALVALDALHVANKVIDQADAWLTDHAPRLGTGQELAWTAWCSAARGRSNLSVFAQLREHQRDDGSFERNPFVTAIALLANPDL